MSIWKYSITLYERGQALKAHCDSKEVGRRTAREDRIEWFRRPYRHRPDGGMRWKA